MRLVFILLAAALLVASAGAVNDVILKYNKLFVDGKEYIIKGMSYNPAPLSFLDGVRARPQAGRRALASHIVPPYRPACAVRRPRSAPTIQRVRCYHPTMPLL